MTPPLRFLSERICLAAGLFCATVSCSTKDDALASGSISGHTNAQYVSTVRAVAGNGQVVTTTPALDGSFTLAGVLAGAATVSCVHNPATVPVGYFPPRPVSATVSPTTAFDTGFIQPTHSDVSTGTITWTIDGQPQQGTILSAYLAGFPPALPQLYVQARSPAGELVLAPFGITGLGTYPVGPLTTGDIAYYSGADSFGTRHGGGSVSLSVFDPVNRRITGTASFVMGGFAVPTGAPTGVRLTGTAQFDLNF